MQMGRKTATSCLPLRASVRFIADAALPLVLVVRRHGYAEPPDLLLAYLSEGIVPSKEEMQG